MRHAFNSNRLLQADWDHSGCKSKFRYKSNSCLSDRPQAKVVDETLTNGGETEHEFGMSALKLGTWMVRRGNLGQPLFEIARFRQQKSKSKPRCLKHGIYLGSLIP